MSPMATKEYNNGDSMDSEDWQEEEEWRDNFVFSGDGGEEEEDSGDVNAFMTGVNHQHCPTVSVLEVSYERVSTNNVDTRKSWEGVNVSLV